jgi:hypothetical protein
MTTETLSSGGRSVTYQFAIPAPPESGVVAGQSDWPELLESFLNLRDGWDGHRAPRPSEHAVARALVLMGALESEVGECAVEIAPFLDGGVAITIEHPSGRWLDLTIENDRTLTAERSDESGGRKRVTDLERLTQWLLLK